MSHNDILYDFCEDALTLDGFDGCDIGLCLRFGQQPIVIYNRDKCIARLVDRDGMTHGEAEEFFEFNVIGAWMGEGTPAFFEPNESFMNEHY